MKKTIPSPFAYSQPAKPFEQVVGSAGISTGTSAVIDPLLFEFGEPTAPEVHPAPHFKPIGDIVERWNRDSKRRQSLEDARRWVARKVLSDEGETVRTMRLQKGWSQVQLAARLGTSQSHVARIERGTENLSLDTCRRLCIALGVDMNTLDSALKRQEQSIHQASVR